MNRKKYILLLIVIGFIQNSFSQSLPDGKTIKRNNFFYVSPFDLFLNTIQVGYERKFKNHNTFVLNGGFKLSKKDEIVNRLGGNGEFQYRVNLLYNKEAVSSLMKEHSTFAYFAPFFQYRYEEISDEVPVDSEKSRKQTTYVNSSFAGFGFGIRLSALENRFSMNAFAGGGLKYSDVLGDKKYADFIEVGYTGIAPKVSFQIGISF